jgi:hypothetical protein
MTAPRSVRRNTKKVLAERGPSIHDGTIQTQLPVLAARRARGFEIIFAPLGKRGRRECRMHAAPAVSCAMCTRRCAHEHTGQRRQSDIPCAMALRLMPRSPRRRIRLASVVNGLKVSCAPGWARKTSADLTPATGARTTRFCRTQQRRSSGADRSLTEIRPAIPLARDAIASTATRPTFVTMANAPLPGTGWQ